MAQVGLLQEKAADKHNILTYDLKVGDAVIFDKSTMHASTGDGMNRRHNIQLRLISGDVGDSIYKNTKGSSYGHAYAKHNEPAITFMFPQIFPEVLEIERAQRHAYKKSAKWWNIFHQGRLMLALIESFQVKSDEMCEPYGCYRSMPHDYM